ncbi:unnamed protein product [Adineta ricciae]|uniref:EF-hand domain-containing protein n=1 Tax=Adineta ricciae TaxID=249248 RepID=A0A813PCJ5_ADIRI|nr:unnamed protein product [Adineta ricciae]
MSAHSLINSEVKQFGGGKDSLDTVQGAFSAYKMFSDGQGGGVLDDISTNDKINGDGKITAEDIQIYLREMGLGEISPYMTKALFKAVDKNGNDSLDFTDLMDFSTMVNRFTGNNAP